MAKLDVEDLFTPLQLGSARLANRFVMPGMQRGWCIDGAPSATLTDYYCRRVKGQAGLIITEAIAVDHPSATQNPAYAWLTAKTAPRWSACVSAVKAAGGNILLQLFHEGAMREEGGNGPLAGHPTLSPSGVVGADRAAGRAITGEELAEIRDAFVASALLAKAAGADGVEVHAAHGYLLDQFLWNVTNRRQDGYGGDDAHHRVRLPCEIIAGIRAACGPDFIISFRFSQWKQVDYSARIARTSEELAVIVNAVKAAGVDVLHASTRRFWEPEWPGSDLNLAGWARRLSGLPVITVGSVGLTGDVMDSLFGHEVRGQVREGVRELGRRFAQSEFDLVSVGRSLIADPDWIIKIRAGCYDEVRVFDRGDLDSPGDVDALVEGPA